MIATLEPNATVNWTSAERRAWSPPEDLKPSEWAERYRYIPKGQSSRPGQWRNENAPYLRGVMDLAAAPGVEELTCVKGVQLGFSDAFRNLIGYWSDIDPEPMGLTLPNKDKGRKIVSNRVIPMFRQNARLRDLLTDRAHDIQSEQLRLVNGLILHLMWSGSPAAMASDPMCRVINDEVDKFEEWSGREADPISLVRKRVTTYEGRSILINISTPTTREGKIWQLFEASNVHGYFFVPCPHCGVYQRLDRDHLRWDEREESESRAEHAARIRATGAVRYICPHCGAEIDDRDKPQMVRAGVWRDESGDIPDFEAVERWPKGTRIGLQMGSLYSLFRSWASIAGEYIESKDGGLAAVMDTRNSTDGLPFEEQLSRAGAKVFSDKSKASDTEEGVVPAWAGCLLATIDTQHDHFWAIVRAWGPGMRSARVWHGRVETFQELEAIILNREFPFENGEYDPLTVHLALIDSGGTRSEDEEASRTMDVYRWVLGRQPRVRAIKGADKPRQSQRIWAGSGFLKRRSQDPIEVPIIRLHTHHFHDELQAKILSPDETWLLNNRDDDEYNRHLSNVHKIPIRRGRTGKIRQEWVPLTAGARIDLRDCEAYQIAAAYIAMVHTWPPQAQFDERRASQRRRRNKQQEEERSPDVRRKRMDGRGDRWKPQRWH